MDDISDAGREPGRAAPPERAITVNMLVAYNIARWRRAAGMTQEQLGAELGGWTKTAVSAAERSWDGRRVRKFDADELADLASIFRIPIPAFFLPPDDDGTACRYVIASGSVPMEEYYRCLMTELNWEADSRAGAAYQQAVITAEARYVGSEAAAEVAAAVPSAPGLAAAEQITAALAEARAAREELQRAHPVIGTLLEQNALLQDVLERALAKRRQP